jgi:hypothetical protein
VDRIHLAQDRDQWWTLVYMVPNFGFYERWEIGCHVRDSWLLKKEPVAMQLVRLRVQAFLYLCIRLTSYH